jgi:hypothetical protein
VTSVLTVFEALAAAVTLVMIFALQHTQARQQAAIQRKLDEILQSLPGADNHLVRVVSASERHHSLTTPPSTPRTARTRSRHLLLCAAPRPPLPPADRSEPSDGFQMSDSVVNVVRLGGLASSVLRREAPCGVARQVR